MDEEETLKGFRTLPNINQEYRDPILRYFGYTTGNRMLHFVGVKIFLKNM